MSRLVFVPFGQPRSVQSGLEHRLDFIITKQRETTRTLGFRPCFVRGPKTPNKMGTGSESSRCQSPFC